MIRLYLDSDVINNIHAEHFTELISFINQNRNKLTILYSDAHIYDKLPSKESHEEIFYDDLDFLTQFTDSHLIQFSEKKGYALPIIASAREVLEQVLESRKVFDKLFNIDKVVSFIEELCAEHDIPELGKLFRSSMEQPAYNRLSSKELQGRTIKDLIQLAANHSADLLNKPGVYKEEYNYARKTFNLPKHSGQWTDEVIPKINNHIVSNGLGDNFFSLVDNTFTDKKKINQFSYFTQAYYMLNLVGYRSDEIVEKKKKGITNHIQDAKHSFYAAHCDYFVIKDKKLEAKSNALYEEFGITTKIIHPSELKKELNSKWNTLKINEIFKTIYDKKPVDVVVEGNVTKTLFKLNEYYLNYFTNIQIEQNSQTGIDLIIFLKMGANYSKFLFHREV